MTVLHLGDPGWVGPWCSSQEQPLGHITCPYGTTGKCACTCHRTEGGVDDVEESGRSDPED